MDAQSKIVCFVSCSLDQEDDKIRHFFRALLRTQKIEPYIEDSPGPWPPSQKVRASIRDADCLMAVLTRKHRVEDGTWRATEWIYYEIGMAYAHGKPVIAFLEEGVKPDALIRSILTYVVFSRENLPEKRHEFNRAVTKLIENARKDDELVRSITNLDTELTPRLLKIKQVLDQFGALESTEDEEHFYKKGIEIVNISKEVRLASKTPALILPQERLTPKRAEYYLTLVDQIKAEKIRFMYLFSSPATNRNLVYLWKSPIEGKSIAVVHLTGLQVERFKRYFDRIFQAAKVVDRQSVEGWISQIK